MHQGHGWNMAGMLHCWLHTLEFLGLPCPMVGYSKAYAFCVEAGVLICDVQLALKLCLHKRLA